MCGIAGIVHTHGINKVHHQLIEDMARIQIHRGPDSTGFAEFEKVLLAHNRLSLIDLNERANQPFRCPDRCLIYNGEIYNYQLIKDELIKNNQVVFTGTSDTEVLFHALIQWGVEKTLKRIKGMFAFAFYDLSSDRLVLARDRIGIKPLFYMQKDGAFYFTSELKALVATQSNLGLHVPRLMQASLGALENSRKYTAFENIYQLEPGCVLSVDLNKAGAITHETYFKTSDWVDENEWRRLNVMHISEVDSLFSELFENSIKSTLVADAGLGAFVSAGVDSALCAAYSRKYRSLNLYTANVVGEFSELTGANIIARFCNSNLFAYEFKPDMFVRDWVASTWYYDGPIVVHPSAIPFQNVASLARNNGDKAVITGEGSDELFLGYPRLLTKRFDKLILSPRNLLNTVYSKIPGLKRYLNLTNSNYFGDTGNMSYDYERNIKEESYKQAFTFLKSDPSFREQLLTLSMIDNGLHSLLWRNDRMGMMHSIESRFPFLTDEVMRFGINLPVKFKIGLSGRFHNWKHPFLIDKAVVRRLANAVLPKECARKKKEGFPMYGQMFVHVGKALFENGFWQESMQMSNKGIDYMVNHIEPYLLAKLASVEIWGRLFCWKNSIEEVNQLVLKHTRMKLN